MFRMNDCMNGLAAPFGVSGPEPPLSILLQLFVRELTLSQFLNILIKLVGSESVSHTKTISVLTKVLC